MGRAEKVGLTSVFVRLVNKLIHSKINKCSTHHYAWLHELGEVISQLKEDQREKELKTFLKLPTVSCTECY